MISCEYNRRTINIYFNISAQLNANMKFCQAILFLSLIQNGFMLLLDGQPVTVPTLRQELQQEIQQLRTEFLLMKDMMTTLHESVPSCAVSKKQRTPAFMATLTKSNQACAEGAPLIFDRELLDTRNVYDVRHGTFRAPVNGTYVFTATLTAMGGKYVNVKIVKNFPTNQIALLFIDNRHSLGNWNQRSTTVVVELAIGDDVWLVCVSASEVNGGNDVSHNDFDSHLSGFLIDEL
ncbi:complement C1q and tumor necrosis factor-related protein 9A-like [Dreissena polymorpha]|uniref:complement C1q and tumor necrosis factor-related protein 9A-like n=1 Tax=Dreissena polymorpha TaxID=45954 RepID=UPI0022648816|nr:complement C1q and tumor necrosis factor-related protein 9A-like [Dreissena polymorpha]